MSGEFAGFETMQAPVEINTSPAMGQPGMVPGMRVDQLGGAGVGATPDNNQAFAALFADPEKRAELAGKIAQHMAPPATPYTSERGALPTAGEIAGLPPLTEPPGSQPAAKPGANPFAGKAMTPMGIQPRVRPIQHAGLTPGIGSRATLSTVVNPAGPAHPQRPTLGQLLGGR